nr:hypothetical protein [Tanacetum cinerariifolium]
MQSFLASKRLGYVTNSLLEQWRETNENVDYDDDPYDDDMYKGQKIPDNIQSIRDNLDIKLRSQYGRKKKEWRIREMELFTREEIAFLKALVKESKEST